MPAKDTSLPDRDVEESPTPGDDGVAIGFTDDEGQPDQALESEAEDPDDDLADRWGLSLSALPAARSAVLELCGSTPGDFGWLIGLDGQGRLVRLALDRVSTRQWAAAYTALRKTPSGRKAREEENWHQAADFSRSWELDGPRCYRFLHVDLLNLRDSIPELAESFSTLHKDRQIRTTTLAVAELLCAEPVAYWWLGLAPAIEDWEGLFAALKLKGEELLASCSPADIQATWNAEGRPVVRAQLDLAP